MFYEIKELETSVWISAFKIKQVNVEKVLQAVQQKAPDATVQLVDLESVPGSRYLLLATLNAIKSFRSKHAIARSLSMEMLLYIAANRQIGEALKSVGVTNATRRVAVVAVANTRTGVSDVVAALHALFKVEDSEKLVDEWNTKRLERVQGIFTIGDKELGAIRRKNEDQAKVVERLAIEKSAMLAIRR